MMQQQEERALLTPSSENPQGSQHVALSAPTTPPRGSPGLTNGDAPLSTGGTSGLSFLHHQAVTNGIPDEFKRHSANYGSLASQSVENGANLAPGSHNYAAGAKSMPGSRRGSSGSSDAAHDMVASLNLSSLSIQDKQIPRINGMNGGHPLRSTTNPEVLKAHAASLFDEDLDNEMSSMSSWPLIFLTFVERFLPHKNPLGSFPRRLKMSVSMCGLIIPERFVVNTS